MVNGCVLNSSWLTLQIILEKFIRHDLTRFVQKNHKIHCSPNVFCSCWRQQVLVLTALAISEISFRVVVILRSVELHHWPPSDKETEEEINTFIKTIRSLKRSPEPINPLMMLATQNKEWRMISSFAVSTVSPGSLGPNYNCNTESSLLQDSGLPHGIEN